MEVSLFLITIKDSQVTISKKLKKLKVKKERLLKKVRQVPNGTLKNTETIFLEITSKITLTF